MNDQEVLKILEDSQAILSGHFVYTSDRHGTGYVNKDALYLHTEITSLLCREIAKRFLSDDVETVVGPAMGGIILSQWLAHHLQDISKRKIFAVYAEQTQEGFGFKRGYDEYVRNRRVLVVEDILNTGRSATQCVQGVRDVGGIVVGLGVLCNRGSVTSVQAGNPPRLEALTNLKMISWEEHECPLCKAGEPVNTAIGHGATFLARQK